MSLKFRLINMRNQKLHDKFFGEIELYPNYFFWQYRCVAEEPKIEDDHESGWEFLESCFERTALLKNIVAIDLEFHDTPERNQQIDADKWSVRIQVEGANTDCVMYFRKEQEARNMRKLITDWWMAAVNE
jgi:hypothetical protein